MNKINIIDCTLRDGGYYNNWDFPKNLVNEYLKSVSDSGIKYVELGFRSLSKKEFNDGTQSLKNLKNPSQTLRQEKTQMLEEKLH